MTSSSPSDEPTFYARSATLESPRPIHIPEPSNIPVLENQIDPIFNLMTTHLPAPHATRNMTAIDHEMASLAASSQPTPGLSPEGSGDLAEPQVVNDLDAEAVAHGVEIQAGSEAAGEAQGNAEKANSTIVDHQTSSLTEQLPVSLVALGDSSSKPVAEPEAAILSPPQSSMQKATLSPEQSQAPVNGQQPDGTNGVIEALTGDNQEEEGNKDNALSAGVNLEALLNNIATTSDTALAAAEAAAGAQNPDADAQTPNDANPPSASLPSSAGLPPRPPPQEKPAIHPNYAPTDDIRSFHFPNLAPSSAQSSHSAQSPTASNSFRPAQLPAHLPSPVVGGGTGSNGLPPPPMASFQQPQTPNESKAESNKTRQPPPRLSDANATSPTKPPPGSREDEDRWPAEIQAKYNQFLRDEEEYTKEGTWDKFPQGSRLFIGECKMIAMLLQQGQADTDTVNLGNLPTEVVTKRDIFHIFHRYGRLAQISIKQAYGFVQFMETKDCQMAIQTEQNGKIKDRSMRMVSVIPEQRELHADTAQISKSRSRPKAHAVGAEAANSAAATIGDHARPNMAAATRSAAATATAGTSPSATSATSLAAGTTIGPGVRRLRVASAAETTTEVGGTGALTDTLVAVANAPARPTAVVGGTAGAPAQSGARVWTKMMHCH